MTPSDQPNSSPAAGAPALAHLGAVLHLLDRPISPDDLAAGTQDAAQRAETRRSGTAGVLLFRLDEETFAVPARLLRRITPYTPPCPIPHRTSGTLRGLCNIRGELVLCADLRRMLGLPSRNADERAADSASDPRRMVVIGPTEASWVFEVDAIIGVERIDPAALSQPPMTVEHAIGAFVTGLTELAQLRITVLDGDRILAGFKAGLS